MLDEKVINFYLMGFGLEPIDPFTDEDGSSAQSPEVVIAIKEIEFYNVDFNESVETNEFNTAVVLARTDLYTTTNIKAASVGSVSIQGFREQPAIENLYKSIFRRRFEVGYGAWIL